MKYDNIRQIAQLGPSGFGCAAVVDFQIEQLDAILSYTFPTGDEDFNPGRILFKGVEGYRWLRNAVTPVEITVGFDTLAEAMDSEWAAGATQLLRSSPLTKDVDIHHYLVYFDEFGCYEVLAVSASLKHEQP